MNISDYSTEALNQLDDIVDSYFDNDPKPINIDPIGDAVDAYMDEFEYDQDIEDRHLSLIDNDLYEHMF